MKEKLIPNFPDYKINEYGEIFSRYKFKTGKIINEWRPVQHVLDKGNGYRLITCVNNITGRRKNVFIHRALAECFIPNPLNKPQVNHIDGIKTNNTLANLEWVTAQENSQHAVDTGLSTYGHCEVKIQQHDLATGLVINDFKSLNTAFRSTGVQAQNISKVCRGLRKQAGGFGWSYA